MKNARKFFATKIIPFINIEYITGYTKNVFYMDVEVVEVLSAIETTKHKIIF